MADYRRYVKKIQALAGRIAFMKRNNIAIFIMIAVVVAVLAGCVYLKGAFVTEIDCPDSIYGESFSPAATVLFSSLRYEYSTVGEDTWTDVKPYLPGEYRVRAVSDCAFGMERYSETTFTIGKRLAVITLNPLEGMYGESVGSLSDVIAGNLADGDIIAGAVFVYDRATVGKTALSLDTESISVIDANGNEVSSAYNFAITDSTVNIALRPITVATSDLEKVYDGQPLLSDGQWTIISGELANGDTVEIVLEDGTSEVAIVDHSIKSLKITSSSGADVTACYIVSKEEGTLKVAKGILNFIIPDGEKVYDGKPLVVDAITELEGTLLDGDVIEALYVTGGIVNVGSMKSVISHIIIRNGDNDVTEQYIIRSKSGTLTVKPRVIRIETSSAEKVYDGKALSNSEYRILSGSAAEGDAISGTNVTEIINVGEAENIVTPIITNSSGNDVSSNYKFEVVPGKLTVTKRPLTVRAVNATREYDTTEFISDAYYIRAGSLADGQAVESKGMGRITEIGTAENMLEVNIIDDSGKDVTENYELTIESGSLTVTKRELVINTDSTSFPYDGKPHSDNTILVVKGSLLDIHSFDKVLTPSLTLIGIIENKLESFDIVDKNGISAMKYYNVTVESTPGFLEVRPRQVILQAKNASKEYDGLPLTNDDYIIEGDGIAEGHTLIGIAGVEGTITEIGKVPNVIVGTPRVLDENSNDVTEYYILQIEEGFLEIIKRQLKFSTGSAKKYYDGTPLTNPEWSLINGSVLSGHTLRVVVTGSQTDIGVSDNICMITVSDAVTHEDVTRYYNIEVDYGKLTVLALVESDPVGTDGNEPPPTGNPSVDEPMIGNSTDPTILGGSSSQGGDNSSSDKNVLIEFYTESKYPVYLRFTSYGDYLINGWDVAPKYSLITAPINPLYLASNALSDSNLSAETIEIRILGQTNSVALPYYTINPPTNKISDSYVPDSGFKTYTLQYLPLGSSDITLSGARIDSAYVAFEKKYYEFVLENYVSLPESTKNAMLEIAKQNGIDPESPTLINDIANFVRSAGYYNKKHPVYPENADIAVYFLTQANEGVCYHYATAATAMYRAMGIPARYTVGYYAVPEEGTWTSVISDYAHAWVEIYISGFGWMPVEVTGGPDPDDPGNNVGATTGNSNINDPFQNGNDPTIYDIELRMDNAEKPFNGMPLTSDSISVIGHLHPGDKVVAKGGGSLTYVGSAENPCESYVILDSLDNDVTDKYRVVFVHSGTLTVTSVKIIPPTEFEMRMLVGEVRFLSDIRWLDGNFCSALTPTFTLHAEDKGAIELGDDTILVGNRVADGFLEYMIPDTDLNGDGVPEVLESVGRINVSVQPFYNVFTEINSLYSDVNSYFVDTSTKDSDIYWYGIDGRVLTKLVVKMKDVSTSFTGKYVTGNEVELISGKLRDGDRIVASGTGAQLYSGSTMNKCGGLMILDASGNDVTSLYVVSVYNGTITVETAMPELKLDSLEIELGNFFDLTEVLKSEFIGNLPLSLSGGNTNGKFVIDGLTVTGIKLGSAVLTVTYLPCDLNGDGYLELGQKTVYIPIKVILSLRHKITIGVMLVVFLPALAYFGYLLIKRIREYREELESTLLESGDGINATVPQTPEEYSEALASGKEIPSGTAFPMQIDLKDFNKR